jgi:tRNA dimethylallyltransferase
MSVFILTGPTASGKSAVAMAMAPRLNAEIISADSMQVYRGMDIGTAKPSREERARVRHHLIDIKDPWESFSVADFIHRAEEAIAEIHARGTMALLVGGTPMYIKGFIKGLFSGPAADWTLRRELVARAEREGVPALHAELARIDPTAARRIHANDLRRIVRGLEVYSKTGRPISEQQREWKTETSRRDAMGIILARSRQDICALIDPRVEHMFRNGLVEEVRRLLAHPNGLGREARQALGYKEVIEHLEGRRGLQETIDLVKLKTRQFAKRQMTWFRSFKEFSWIEARPEEGTEEAAAQVMKVFRGGG